MTHPFQEEERQEVLNELIEVYKQQDIDIVALSGSVLSGKANPYSDIDIGAGAEQTRYRLPPNTLYRGLPISTENSTWQQFMGMVDRPADMFTTMVLGTFKNSKIVYSRSPEYEERYRRVQELELSGELREHQKEDALEKLKTFPGRIGNLWAASEGMDLFTVQRMVIEQVSFMVLLTHMYHGSLVKRNHGLSDMDMDPYFPKMKVLVEEIGKANHTEEVLVLVGKCFQQLVSAIPELGAKLPTGMQDQGPLLLERVNRILSEYHKPDRVGYFTNYLKLYPKITEFYKSQGIDKELYEALHYSRIDFDEDSVGSILQLRDKLIEAIPDEQKTNTPEELLQLLEKYRVD